jgi:hypothetical protein
VLGYNTFLQTVRRQNFEQDSASEMEKTLTITTHDAQAEADRAYWRQQTPEARLEAVEQLRLEAGKFLYDYPARLRRVLEVTRNPSS